MGSLGSRLSGACERARDARRTFDASKSATRPRRKAIFYTMSWMRSFEGAHFAEGSDSDDEEKAAAEAEEKAAAEAKMAAAAMTIPAAPLAPPTTVDPAFLTHINTFIADKLKAKKELFTSLRDAARDIENKATIGLHKRQMGDADGAHADLNASITELRALLLTPGAAETPARSAVTHAAQSVACFQAFDAFLTTGTLGVRASQEVEYDDNEWLLGLISASHEISRYAIGRGTHAPPRRPLRAPGSAFHRVS